MVNDAAAWMEPTWLGIEIIVERLLAASFFGALLGFEREWKSHSAGLRTHILVCLASAILAILTIEIVHMNLDPDRVRLDLTRLVEAVTTGVAFLAAGFIVFVRGEVRGLTTGAGMWLASAIGLATGLGFLQIAAVGTLFAIIVLWILGRLEIPLKERSSSDKDDTSDD